MPYATCTVCRASFWTLAANVKKEHVACPGKCRRLVKTREQKLRRYHARQNHIADRVAKWNAQQFQLFQSSASQKGPQPSPSGVAQTKRGRGKPTTKAEK